MHTLAEYPELDPAQTHRLIVSGIDEIRLRAEAVAELGVLPAAGQRKEVRTV